MNPNLERGRHTCHLYEWEGEFKAVALGFVGGGLSNGESCIYVADRSAVDDWYVEFQAYGIDVRSSRDTGALEVAASDSWRRDVLRGSMAMSRQILELYNNKTRNSTNLRIGGDFHWESEPVVPADRVCHWEATADFLVEELQADMICQYDLNLYTPEFIHSALRTHPVVLYQSRSLLNPFYEAPAILAQEPRLNHSSGDRDFVAGLLATLASIT